MILQKTQSFRWLPSLGCSLVSKPASQLDLETENCRVGAGPELGRIWEQRMASLRDSIFQEKHALSKTSMDFAVAMFSRFLFETFWKLGRRKHRADLSFYKTKGQLRCLSTWHKYHRNVSHIRNAQFSHCYFLTKSSNKYVSILRLVSIGYKYEPEIEFSECASFHNPELIMKSL